MDARTSIQREDVIANNNSGEASVSGVSWAAIIGGAFAAAAVSLILLILGSAFGLSSLSPWSHATMASFTVKTAIWLVIMQWIASGIGGYLTGRLRTKWAGIHTDEVMFRDTAHGFLAWAVATVLIASVISMAVSGGVRATAMVASGVAAGASQPAPPRPDGNFSDPTGYYIDSLFRSATPNPNASTPDVRAESMRILVLGLKNGGVPDADKAYLAQVVSARTGLAPADASKRVDDVIGQLTAAKDKAKEDAEAARKTAMHISFCMALSMLIGAFIASVAATLGGRRRDEYSRLTTHL